MTITVQARADAVNRATSAYLSLTDNAPVAKYRAGAKAYVESILALATTEPASIDDMLIKASSARAIIAREAKPENQHTNLLLEIVVTELEGAVEALMEKLPDTAAQKDGVAKPRKQASAKRKPAIAADEKQA